MRETSTFDYHWKSMERWKVDQRRKIEFCYGYNAPAFSSPKSMKKWSLMYIESASLAKHGMHYSSRLGFAYCNQIVPDREDIPYTQIQGCAGKLCGLSHGTHH